MQVRQRPQEPSRDAVREGAVVEGVDSSPRTLQQWMGHGSIEVTEMYMAFRNRAEDAALVSDAFRVT